MPAVQFVPVDEVVPVSGANFRCVPEAAITIDDAQAQRIAELCAALSDLVRLRMVLVLRESPGGAASLRDLLAQVEAPEPECDDHLRLLVDAGIVRREQGGRCVLIPDALGEILALLGQPAATRA